MRRRSFITWAAALTLCFIAFTNVSAQFAKKGAKIREAGKINPSFSPEGVFPLPLPPIFAEDFNLAAGTLLTASGWTAHSAGGTNAITVSAPGLTMAGYAGSGAGNSVALTTSGEDDNKTFPVQSAGTVYAAFLVNVSEASTDAAGGYFFHLGPDPVSTTFRGRVFAKKDASNNVAFGISKALTTAADIAFTGFTFSLNTTYLVVVRYAIFDGATNDTVAMWVSPTALGVIEPIPTVTATDTAQSDISPGTVSLRQGAAATAPTVRVDGIRVATNWHSATQPFVSKASNDFDGDGRTDFVVLRDSNGASPGGFVDWYVNLNSSGTFYQTQWGIYDVNTEDLAPADYDGDGKTDIAVWRRGASLGTFYILRSATNTIDQDQLGLATDDPAPGDYDGDGDADTAVVRNNGDGTSGWHYRPNTSVNYSTIALNASGSEIAGDYDGDRITDPAVFSDSNATFTIRQSSNGQTVSTQFGTSTDVAAPGDYDGDAIWDLCVVRNVGGTLTWIFKRSIDGVEVSDTWGLAATDFPTPGDYNGDNKWDYAVWREGAQGEFFVMTPVTRQIFQRQWGVTGDYPLAFHMVGNSE